MAPVTPYTADLAGRDPIEAIRESTAAIEALSASWTPPHYERSYAPGKWSARLILTHLAQTELALGTRARMALVTPNYLAENFDQDAWLVRESGLSGPAAVRAFLGAARMNAAFFDGLDSYDRSTPFAHPEYGILTVEWVAYQLAGHQIHHLKQLERLSEAATRD